MIERVDPELRGVLAALPDLSDLGPASLPRVRSLLQGGPPQPVAGLTFEQIEIPGVRPADPAIPAYLYRPCDAAPGNPAILNIHGGGYVAGDAAREHGAISALVQALQCVVLSIDYRLAPEWPYPAPLDDCEAALGWLQDQADILGIDRSRVAVRGVSAGGGLAAGLAIRNRHLERNPVCFLSLLYPMLDDRTRASGDTNHFVWSAGANAFGWRSYLGAARAAPPQDSAPARASDLRGFPPCFIAVGSIDLFASECLAFAARLIDAGVPTECHLYAGAFHGFNLVSAARVAANYQRDQISAFRRAFEQENF